MIKDYFQLSLRGIFRRKLRSWLTMLGIFIGIAAVVSLIGLGEGLRIAIVSQFGFLGTDVLSIQASGINYAGPPGTGAVRPLSNELIKDVERISGVEAAINRYVISGTIEFNDKQALGMAMSIPEGGNREIVEKMMNLKTIDGRLLRDGDGRDVLLGNRFSEKDVFGKAVRAGDSVLMNGLDFEVVGILEKKGSYLFDYSVFVNENILLDYFREDDGTVDVIGVKVRDESKINDIKEDLEKLLRKKRDVKAGGEDFVVETPQQTLETLNSTLFAVQLFVTIIALISLLVGGIGIMNTMYTSVLERTKEIGVMKAVGARNSEIFTLFSIESGMLGLVGGLIGVILGFGIANGLASVGRSALGIDLIQANISPILIISSLLFSFTLGIVFGVIPARRASKMKPVDALRSIK